MTMFSYMVTVFIGALLDSGTLDPVYIKLVGMKGESRVNVIPCEGLQTEKVRQGSNLENCTC